MSGAVPRAERQERPTRELIDTYLRPRWLLRVAGDAAPALAAIQAQPWATRAEHAGVYLFFGLLGPVTAKYLQDIVNRVQSGVQVIVAHPTAKEGIANYISQAGQTGLVIVVVIAASAVTFDARRGLCTFLRTRASSMWQLIAPRFAASAAAAAAYTLGTLAAWYETALLLGQPPAGAMLAGLLCGSAYLVFAVSAATAAASVARGTLAAVGVTLGVLLGLPLLGLAGPLHPWLPSTLLTAPITLLTHASLSDYLPALATAAAGSALLLAVATSRLARREV
jgi:ABC-2 type transport system permease protein